jgi:hypothetical protein
VGDAAATLLGALVGAAAAIVSQLFAPVIQSRTAHQQWVRDKRAEAFAEYFRRLAEAERQVGIIEMGLEIKGVLDMSKSSALAAERPFSDAAAGLEMFASEAVRTEAKRLATDYMVVVAALDYADKPDRLAHFIKAFERRVPTVRQALRKELNISD